MKLKNLFPLGLTLLALNTPLPARPQPQALLVAQAPAPKSTPIDINRADEKTLRTIPGIGEAYARKIIEGRPYKAKDELKKRKILPAALYDKVKGQLVAHQTR